MSHIKAGFLSGYPIRCSFCREEKSAARAYDVDDVTIFDAYGSPAAHGPITICEACRSEFHSADLELDADAMYEWSMNEERRRREEMEIQPDEGGPEWNSPERHKHMTFKVKG